ncbi:MAG TPA: dienelactone hydrolase family protein [Anaerolineales bacterium]|nr:dienelactone hydrolase family protein [Anaerolineales bacterium]
MRERQPDSIRFRRVLRLAAVGVLSALVALDFAMAWLFLDPLLRPGCRVPERIAAFPDPQPVELHTEDELVLEGWYYPSRNGRAVLALGGVGGSLGRTQPPVEFLLEAGYGVLQIGNRACAGAPVALETGALVTLGAGAPVTLGTGAPVTLGAGAPVMLGTGALVTLGALEVLDAEAGLRFLLSRPEIEPGGIALYGFSMGGAAAIQTAARQPAVAAVIAEGGYYNLGDDIVERGSERSLPEFVFLYTLAGVYRLRTGVDPWEVSPIDVIGAISPRPVLLIYGETEAESGRAALQFAAADEPKELWIVPGGGHGTNHLVGGMEYEEKVLEFLARVLGQ